MIVHLLPLPGTAAGQQRGQFMGFIKKVDAPESAHPCLLPPRAGLGIETLWECDSCGDQWELRKSLEDSETVLDWRRVLGRNKATVFHADRYPSRRMPEPTPEDLTRENRIREVLAELEIPEEVLAPLRESNPSAHAPYHGYQHLLTVALNCNEAADYHGLDVDAARALVLAALFHDFGHLLGQTVRDAKNIEAAVQGALLHLPVTVDNLTDEEHEQVIILIRATEFPHREATTVEEQIIQDADMMQTLEPDGKRFIDGLAAETGRRITVEENEEFLDSLKVNTEWGRIKLRPLSLLGR